MTLIRSDRWQLAPTPIQRQHLQRTESLYRSYAQALIRVVFTHWLEIADASSQCAAVERLIHPTKANPNPRYLYFSRNFPKFPSYLRRAVINAAIGQVSSFVTRYNRWQGGIRSRRDANPPRLTADTNLHVVLYQGQCIKFFDEAVEIKVYDGLDWVWIEVPVVKRRKRHLLPNTKARSPSLVLAETGTYLSVPFEVYPPKLGKTERVCGVDLGINTIAVASIIEPDGTVTARHFFKCAADIDRRDKMLQAIRNKARLTMGKTGKLYKGFCKEIYRRAGNINKQIAQLVSRQLVNWASLNGAAVIVFENLKGWRPKGGKRGSSLRQRFHGWLKSRLVKLVEQKLEEVGGKVELVFARGTSSNAYDGSGQVKRSKENYSLCTFTTGKKYNCDLSASYNIGARHWAPKKKKLARRNGSESAVGKSSRTEPRSPVSLSSLWLNKPKAWSKMPHLHSPCG